MRAPAVLIVLTLAFAASADEAPLRLIQTIPLPDGRGRIDHMDLDAARQRLFIAELGNDTVAVVDLKAGKLASRITGVAEPQGVAFAPEFDRLFVTSGETGSVASFTGAALQPDQEVALDSDADNIRYDPSERQLYVGYGSGGLARLAAISGAHVGDIALAGHPESFQLETAGSLIFVNVPDAGDIEVVDRAEGSKVTSWPLASARANFPMALDEPGHRLVVATRDPAALLVLDTRTGKEMARTESCSDADDVFYDQRRRQLYVSCGQGVLDVLAMTDATPKRIAGSRPRSAPGPRSSCRSRTASTSRSRITARPAAEILVYQPAS